MLVPFTLYSILSSPIFRSIGKFILFVIFLYTFLVLLMSFLFSIESQYKYQRPQFCAAQTRIEKIFMITTIVCYLTEREGLDE